MHTATQSGRLRPTTTFVLALALVSSFSLAAFGQDAGSAEERTAEEKIQALSLALRTSQAEIDSLQQKIEKLDDSSAARMLESELSDRRGRQRRKVLKLVTLLVEGEDAGVTVADGRALVSTMLQEDAVRMRKKNGELDAENLKLLDLSTNGSPDEIADARKTLAATIPRSTRLLDYFNENMTAREQLGVDVSADNAYFVERIQARADITSGLLQNTKEEIDALVSRPGSDEDVDSQKEIAALKEQREALAEGQVVNVRLMDEHGLETSQLKQGLITATGKISQDILNKDVASGLLEQSFADAADWLRTNGASMIFQALTFFLILFAFWALARLARGLMRRALDRSKLDISSLARNFFIKMAGRTVLLLGFIIAIAQLGIEVAPLLAGLGIAGFVVGFALQDTLSNFASGMMILVYRPFDVGDVVEAGGVTGKVEKMNLVSTMVLTFDNQLLVVPNKQIWGGVIRNVTHQDTRRVDMKFGIGYSDDILKAEKVLTEIVTSHEKVLKDPEPVIRLHELADSSVNFIVRPWSKTEEYWDVYWDVTREVKRRFDEDGISIPFPQRDVHVYREDPRDGSQVEVGVQNSRSAASGQTVAPSDEET